MTKLKKGIVQVYTGNGKGKTTAAVGLIVRAVGQGLSCCLVQFLKRKSSFSGELKSLETLGVKIIRFDNQECPLIFPGKGPEYQDKFLKSIKESLVYSRELLEESGFDLVVLDEILNVVNNNYANDDDILELVKVKHESTELILTGRNASEKIINAADLVTKMDLKKHPYYEGLSARKGIEF